MRFAFAAPLGVLCASTAAAQLIDSRSLPTTEVGRPAKIVNEYAYLALSSVYLVEGVRVVDDPVIAAERIVLRPGSRLVLGAGKGGDQGERYVAARVIRVEPGTPRPVLTWLRDERPAPVPDFGVKAPSGLPGFVAGTGGGRGGDGNVGNPGVPGRSAPALYLFVAQIEGGPIDIDLRGQDGGAGGVGQDGGDGGPGSPGRRAEFVLNYCGAPAGQGGPGGDGGNGGPGGRGGRGGTGGTLVLVSTPRGSVRAQQLLNVANDGGKGGPAGIGGRAGSPGAGGEPGRPEGTCQAGQPGPKGSPGSAGGNGEPGPDGVQGGRAVSMMAEEQFLRMLGRK
jgi:hypothetical protein